MARTVKLLIWGSVVTALLVLGVSLRLNPFNAPPVISVTIPLGEDAGRVGAATVNSKIKKIDWWWVRDLNGRSGGLDRPSAWNRRDAVSKFIPKRGSVWERNSRDGVPELTIPKRGKGWDKKSIEAWKVEEDVVEGGNLGYVIARSFGQQLESGMYDLHQLADLAHSWNMKLGEPYVRGSKFTLPSTPHGQWKLSDLFDMQDLNNNFRKRLRSSYNIMVNFQEIADDGKLGVDIVVIDLLSYSVTSDRCSRSNHYDIVQRFHTHLGQEQPEKNWATFSVCLNKKYTINFRNLLEDQPVLKQLMLKNRKYGSKFVIIFANWNGIRSTLVNFFYWDPNFHSPSYGSAHSIRHSKIVTSAATDLKRTLGLKSPFIGVHVRLERLIRRPLDYKTIAKCVDSLEATVQLLRGQHFVRSSVMFRDYEMLGSGTCASVHCYKIATSLHLDQRMMALRVTVSSFKPVVTNMRPSLPPLERGFVSTVEQELLSQADYLVVVGYGSYQLGIVERFSAHGPIKQSTFKRVESYPAGAINNDVQRITKICNK